MIFPIVWPICVMAHQCGMPSLCHAWQLLLHIKYIPLFSLNTRLCCIPFLVPILVLMTSPFPPSCHCHYFVFQVLRSPDFCSFWVTIIVSRISGLVCYLVFHSLGNWR